MTSPTGDGPGSRPGAPAGARCTVVGAAGFIGARLCHRLLAEGSAVTALVRPTSRVRHLNLPGVRLVRGDLVTGQGLTEATRGADVVFHLGGVTRAVSEREFQRCNADGTHRLVRAVATAPSPPVLVLCSSLAAVGPSGPHRPRDEGDEPAPVSWYGRSKLRGEEAVRAAADRVPATIVRPTAVYGPGDPLLLPSVLPLIRAGVLPRWGPARRGISLVHVDDVCAALMAAAERGRRLRDDDRACGVYHVSDGAIHSWETFGAALARAAGRRRPPVVLPLPGAAIHWAATVCQAVSGLRGGVPALTRDKARELAHPWWTCSIARARRELDFVPAFSLDRGLADALAASRPAEARRAP
ncbi:NAD-dependent epimerase/dehydratase family protein [Streptomyces sp. URMC 123]|uniref:NAD-dependent epimerase/dehydratase family protein n=1 Tax=Streptomyces sp. URMC 123 TaxID=3423403 RepID=UPI003F1932B7